MKAAEQNNVQAQTTLGKYYSGLVPRMENPQKAKQWYESAALLHGSEAEFQLSLIYFRGDGVPKSDVRGFEYAKQAAVDGSAKAQLLLATAYGLGKGTTQDTVESMKWANIANASGNKDAAKYLKDLEEVRPEKVQEAQKVAAEWWAAHPKQQAIR